MNSLWRSIVSNKKQDNYFKDQIITQLNHSVKDVLLLSSEQEILQTDEITNTFCTTLEALFLHGLRETLFEKVSAITSDIIEKPRCNFWPIILIFSHREVINSVNQLNFVTNDVGRCRAWLRLSLNQNSLLSYLTLISMERSSLGSYYKKTALLRDTEKLGLAMNLLRGVMNFKFELAVNSSLLNFWCDEALILSGVWLPTLSAKEKITQGTDLVSQIKDDIKESEDSVLSLSSYNSSVPSYSLPGGLEIDEKEILDKILNINKPSDKNYNNNVKHINNTQESISSKNIIGQSKQYEENEACGETNGESSNQQQHDSFNVEPSKNVDIPSIIINGEPTDVEEDVDDQYQFNKSNKPKDLDAESFNTLISNYKEGNDNSTDIEGDIGIDQLLIELKQKHQKQQEEEPVPIAQEPGALTIPPPVQIYEEGFEIIAPNVPSPLDAPEFSNLAQYLTKIPKLRGLNEQNYLCRECFKPIGINIAPSYLCRFTNNYFCSECFGENKTIIPTRIIYNWDFGEKPVCKKAKVFLHEIFNHPFFNVKLLNPRLYILISKMTEVHYLRVKLNYIKTYLHSCKLTDSKFLHAELWPRDYLYEMIYVFSLLDLKEISENKLIDRLNNIIKVSLDHISKCILCKAKGHICEMCSNHEVIFPFDLEHTHTCQKCKTTFHKTCYQQTNSQCPKCKRILERKAAKSRDCEKDKGEPSQCEQPDFNVENLSDVKNNQLNPFESSDELVCDKELVQDSNETKINQGAVEAEVHSSHS